MGYLFAHTNDAGHDETPAQADGGPTADRLRDDEQRDDDNG